MTQPNEDVLTQEEKDLLLENPAVSSRREEEMPFGAIELQSMLTNPQWGKEVAPELYEQVSEIIRTAYYNKNNELVVEKKALWGLLNFYTRDIRLGNLKGEEIPYCRYYLDFAGDCLRDGYIKGFMTALSRSITVLEVSQSKDGFLRKQQKTIRRESHFSDTSKSSTGGTQ